VETRRRGRSPEHRKTITALVATPASSCPTGRNRTTSRNDTRLSRLRDAIDDIRALIPFPKNLLDTIAITPGTPIPASPFSRSAGASFTNLMAYYEKSRRDAERFRTAATT